MSELFPTILYQGKLTYGKGKETKPKGHANVPNEWENPHFIEFVYESCMSSCGWCW